MEGTSLVSVKPKRKRPRRRSRNKKTNIQAENEKVVCKVPTQQKDISINWKHLRDKLANHSQSKEPNKSLINGNGSGEKSNNVNKGNELKNCQSKMFTENLPKKNDIWFEDVDLSLILSSQLSSDQSSNKSLCKMKSFTGLTNFVAMDCEMVGTGFNGTVSILARVSIVNQYGHCVYDKFVKPTEEVTDYRTNVSGIRPENLVNGEDFKIVQSEVFKIIENRILVGHSVHHDLKVLFLSHPKHMTRDTSSYFRKHFNNRSPSLKKLSEIYLGVKIQSGEHDSITDAQATMRLFTLFKKEWEPTMKRRFRNKSLTQKTAVL